jgi:hypothetical protein
MNRKEHLKDQETPSAGFQNHMLRDITWFIAGVGIGSGVALLLAPKEGEEIRHAISRGCRKTLKGIGRHTEGLRDDAEDLLEHTKDLFAHALHFGRSGEAERRNREA